MSKCAMCGNNYDKTFLIIKNEKEYNFDSFECAIHMLAEECAHCKCKIIGHGVESEQGIFCCAHCARQLGETGLTDRDG